MANEDLDLSSIDALPDPDAQPKPSAELDALATAIQTTASGIGADAQGRTPEAVAADAAAAVTATRDLATMMATVEECIRILKKAAADWRKDAPKKAELDAAEKAVENAKTAVATAQKAEDEATSDAAKAIASNAVNAANTSLQKAIRDLAALKAKRKSADEAYERERKKATAKLAALNKTVHDGDSPVAPTGTTSPGTGSGTGAVAGTPAAKPSGTPAGTPKPTGTPSPTTTAPSSAAPSSTTGKDADLNTAALAAALAGQNQNQQPQAQQAATTPQASTPQQATPPQQDKKDDPNKKTTDAIDVDDLIREGALPASAAAATLTGVGGANTTTAAPVANGTTTTFRPASTAIPGTLPGGTPAPAPAPATSGNSVEGLNTKSDVTGRSTPAPTAFSPNPAGAETKTSGAHGAGNTAQQAAQQQAGQRGTGMPMMPMVPPVGGAPASGGGRSGGDDDASRIVGRGTGGERLLGDMEALKDAVPGGTIAQNKPDRDKPNAA